jgi:hypothetical protein
MLRRSFILIVFLMLLGDLAFGQEKPKAYKFAEFGVITAKGLSTKMQAFYSALKRGKTSQGCIINYGTTKAIRSRRKLFLSALSNIRLPDYDPPRVTFIDGPWERKVHNVMWIVPNGAETPAP